MTKLTPLRCRKPDLRSVLLLLASAAICQAGPPQISNLNLRGLQAGGTTTLTIDGTDLFPAARVSLDGRFLEAAIDPASTSSRLIVAVPLPDNTEAGLAVLRVATIEGFSNSMLVGIDSFPQLPLAEAVPSLPAALHGSVPGSGVSRTMFTGKQGQEIIAEVEARRLGSRMRPVIHIYDSKRIQIAWGLPANVLSGDSRAVVTLPRDGTYTVEIHDLQYAPPGPSFFRLRLGNWKSADLAFPLALTRGQSRSFELLGLAELPRLEAGAPPDTDLFVLPLGPASSISGLPPAVTASDYPELVESADHSQPTPLLTIPVAISGRLATARQTDAYTLMVTPGGRLLFEVFAERIGSPLDLYLEIKNAEGAVLAQADDLPTSVDPRQEFTVPAGVSQVEIVVRDNLAQSSPLNVYRLVCTSLDSPRAGFAATASSDAINVPVGETQVFPVLVDRQAYHGPISLQFPSIPPGIVVQGSEIPAGSHGTLVTFANPGDSTGQSVSRLIARSPEGTPLSPVRLQPPVDDRTPAWTRETFAIAAAPRPASVFAIAWANESRLPNLRLHSKTSVTVGIVRPGNTFGPVRLSLVTSQPLPQGNPVLAIRLEQPGVEIPIQPQVKAAGDALAAADQQLAEAVAQAKAAQGDAKLAPEAKVLELTAKRVAAQATLKELESKATYSADLALIVPSMAAEPSCDIAVQAELLNVDRNRVLRTVFAPVRRLPIVNPLAIKLAAKVLETPFDAKAGATIKVAGRIERLAGYQEPVTVSLGGLPAGIAVPNVALKPEESAFSLDIVLPATFADGEIKGVRVTATGPPDALSGNLPVKAPDAELTLALKRVQ